MKHSYYVIMIRDTMSSMKTVIMKQFTVILTDPSYLILTFKLKHPIQMYTSR